MGEMGLRWGDSDAGSKGFRRSRAGPGSARAEGRWQALDNSWVLPQTKSQRRFTAQSGNNPNDHHQGDGTSHMISKLRLGDKKK